jgi:hypothetical protein
MHAFELRPADRLREMGSRTARIDCLTVARPRNDRPAARIYLQSAKSLYKNRWTRLVVVKCRRWLATLLFAAIACASRPPDQLHGPARSATTAPPAVSIVPGVRRPRWLDGLPCRATGPTMAVKFLARTPGKRPLQHAVADVRIRNPLRDAVWFLYDFSDDLPTAVNSVTLSRTSSTPPHAYLWSLAGDGGGQALRFRPAPTSHYVTSSFLRLLQTRRSRLHSRAV